MKNLTFEIQFVNIEMCVNKFDVNEYKQNVSKFPKV